MYSLTYNMDVSVLYGTLGTISSYMQTSPPTFDVMETYIPANNANYFYCTVLTTYLYALKHEILEATVHKLQGRKAEAGVAAFLAHSHKAQEELAKLLKKRKAHSIPTWRPDHDPLTQLRHYLGTRQLAKHIHLHGSGNIPAHLKRYQEGYERPQPPAKSNLTDAQKHSFEENNELDLSFGVKNLSRFRANIYMQRGAVSGAFRTIPFKIMSFQDLGLPQVVADLSTRPRGLVLVTGPTGSGKTTAIYASLYHIDERQRIC
jgi:flagellar biosynthesis GTPase FlhF